MSANIFKLLPFVQCKIKIAFVKPNDIDEKTFSSFIESDAMTTHAANLYNFSIRAI